MIEYDIIAKTGKEHRWKGNILQKMAEEIVRYAIPIEEVVKRNITEDLLRELVREIKNKEIIKMQINAKPRLSKSTVAIIVGMFIDYQLKKCGLKSKDIKFGMKNIARDQNEYAKMMRDPNLMNDVRIVDENNKSEATGENSTAEQAQRETISDVQAGRYVHTIYSCPDGTMDLNTDIKLEVRNKEKGLTHTRVYYYLRNPSLAYGWIMIGVADFDVSSLIKNWIIVEPRFMKFLKDGNIEDKKYVDYWRKRDFYIEYMCKKYEKMELMIREGIQHARDLDYAEMRENIVREMKPLAELMFISLARLKNNVETQIESEFRKRSLPLTILGKNEETNRIMGFLGLYRTRKEMGLEIKSLQIKKARNKISEEEFDNAIELISEGIIKIREQIEMQENDLKKLKDLNHRYNNVNEEKNKQE